MLWWVTFLEAWNGTSMILGQRQEKSHIWTDASGGYGCGTWDPASEEWIQLAWIEVDRRDRMAKESISAKRLVPIVIACAECGGTMDRQGSDG